MKKTFKKMAMIAAIGLSSILPTNASDWKMIFEPAVGYENYKVKVPGDLKRVSVTGDTGYWDVSIISTHNMKVPEFTDYTYAPASILLGIAHDTPRAIKNFRIGKKFSYGLENTLSDSQTIVDSGEGDFPDAAVNLKMETINLLYLEKDLFLWENEKLYASQDSSQTKLSITGELNQHNYDALATTYRVPFGDEWYMSRDQVRTSEKGLSSGKSNSGSLGIKYSGSTEDIEGFIEASTGIFGEEVKKTWGIRAGFTLKF